MYVCMFVLCCVVFCYAMLCHVMLCMYARTYVRTCVRTLQPLIIAPHIIINLTPSVETYYSVAKVMVFTAP